MTLSLARDCLLIIFVYQFQLDRDFRAERKQLGPMFSGYVNIRLLAKCRGMRVSGALSGEREQREVQMVASLYRLDSNRDFFKICSSGALFCIVEFDV